MILVPIAVILMIIIPQNQILLAVDLAVLPFMVVMTIPITRGNVLKTVIIGTVIIKQQSRPSLICQAEQLRLARYVTVLTH